MTDQQLIDQYLLTHTVTKLPAVEPVFEPYEGKLQSIGAKPIYDNYGRRIYQNLDKTMNILPCDETMRNYGKDC
jgi:hypothetical protein